MRLGFPIVFAAAAVISCGVAMAQNLPAAPGSTQVVPEKVQKAPLGTTNPTSGRSSNLSDKLNSTNGVIKPSGDVDPGMTKKPPVPNPNSTPVIPPPGSPGGPSGVVPK